ncbi:Bug family tripartite tricarboxylate transporter substrate binding protein [Bordetella trematum]|uniref:Bug family tripartite tricarboxylate transporter substrate binding protein n=1 Tax=Bordetella trematum TaxID=123899 RepID=UPI003AF3DED6
MARAPGNGKTILMGSSGMLSINTHTYSNLSYSPDRDFKMVTGFVAAPMLMAINKDIPASNVKEFVEWVKQNPEKANYGSFSTGNPSHFAGYMLNKATGMELQNIPYTGGTRYIQDLVGGRLTSLFAQRLNLDSFYKDGRLKIIATSADERSPDMPSVQTFKEQGFPELSFMMWTTLAVPASTEDGVVRELNAKLTKAMTAPEVVKRLKDIDFAPMASGPEETHAFVQAESDRWKAIVDQTGFRVN